MEVRRLRSDDAELGVEAIRVLKTPDGSPTPAVDYLVRFLARPEHVFIVAIEDGAPVGYIVAYLLDRIDRDRQMMFFYEIAVAESYRRRGIGTAMITELKTICGAQDVMKMWVPTGRSNIAATRLYASTGGTPLPDGDEVTYAYTRDSFMPPRQHPTDDER